MAVRHYRGWTIEPDEGTQIGHSLPGSRSSRAQIGLGTHRKWKGYVLTYPPDGATKLVDTLKEATAYIDQYMGPADSRRAWGSRRR